MSPGSTHLLSSPTEEVARQLALGHLETWERTRARLDDPSDKDALHDFRVALRRLRSVFRAFRPTFHALVPSRLRRRLRRLADATSESRDLEVQRAWLDSQLGELSGRQRAGAKWMISTLEHRDRSVGEALHRRVEKRFAPLCTRLREVLTEGSFPPAGERQAGALAGAVVAQVIARWTAGLETELGAIHAISDDAEAHAARIAVKRLRYLLEPFQKELDGAPAAIARLKKLQDLLGDLHDSHRIADRLREAHRAGVAGHADQAYGELLFSRKGHAPEVSRIPDVRLGLVALARLLRTRAEELFQRLEVDWLQGDGARSLIAELRAIGRVAGEAALPGVEIERKFLLRAVPRHVLTFPREEIEQGWLPGTKLMERLRRVHSAEGDRWYRTVKAGQGLTRLEIEEATTETVFNALWPLTAGCRVKKQRYLVPEGSLTWEIDEFLDRELVLAEIELPSEETPVAPPPWLNEYVLREVTGETAYLNRVLAR